MRDRFDIKNPLANGYINTIERQAVSKKLKAVLQTNKKPNNMAILTWTSQNQKGIMNIEQGITILEV